jgi:hypothetical protein
VGPRPEHTIDFADGFSRSTERLLEGVMKRIIRANIDRFRLLLESETDPTKRAMLHRLLAEQEVKLDVAENSPEGNKKAF